MPFFSIIMEILNQLDFEKSRHSPLGTHRARQSRSSVDPLVVIEAPLPLGWYNSMLGMEANLPDDRSVEIKLTTLNLRCAPPRW